MREDVLAILLDMGIDPTQDFMLFPDETNDENRKNAAKLCYIGISEGFANLEEFLISAGVTYAHKPLDQNMYAVCNINYCTLMGEESFYGVEMYELPYHSLYARVNYKARKEGLTIHEFYDAYGFNARKPGTTAIEVVVGILSIFKDSTGVVNFTDDEDGIEGYARLVGIARILHTTFEELVQGTGIAVGPIPTNVVEYEQGLKDELLTLFPDMQVCDPRNEIPTLSAKIEQLATWHQSTLKSLIVSWGFKYVDLRTKRNLDYIAECLRAIYPDGIVYDTKHLGTTLKTKIRNLRKVGNKSVEDVLELVGFRLATPAEHARKRLEASIVDNKLNIDVLAREDAFSLTSELRAEFTSLGITVYSAKEDYLLRAGKSAEEISAIIHR